MPNWFKMHKLFTWLKSAREPLSFYRSTPEPSKNIEKSLQDRILQACSGSDVSTTRNLLDEWHHMLFQHTAESGTVETLEHLLHRYGTTPELQQRMLELAAKHCNVPVFAFLLHQEPEPVIDDAVRGEAIIGGVEIWKLIADRRPELLKWDFGEKGDLITFAALMNQTAVLEYFLAAGLDPNDSHFFVSQTFHVIQKMPNIKPEIVDLMRKYGATDEKAAAANKKWRCL
ncbi:MAG: hypothetical protein Q9183_003793 [Haloplaca sp. 2 TL-2023]